QTIDGLGRQQDQPAGLQSVGGGFEGVGHATRRVARDTSTRTCLAIIPFHGPLVPMSYASRSSEKPPIICAASPRTRKVTGKATGRVRPFTVTSARAVNCSGATGSSDRNWKRISG